ncbi:MAG: bifunctional biotin--[acetyl-CoA-carboxylase] ligase/biotin operon repressor BirA [Gammaproteobacteria bacterium]|nr:MAG: bifunctional biotin--[acetyl-CoA-carboxylase] ligase/biotin operon repressor BirA [Gammaproteobacteria bacterium]
MSNYRKIIQLLNDGEYHSGTTIGESLNIGRSAIWKSIEQLRELGVNIESAGRKGYHLHQPIELLDEALINKTIQDRGNNPYKQVEIFETIESTNTYLMQVARDHTCGNRTCMAELQTGGKGRNGRKWLGSFATNIALSVLWRFETLAGGLSGLSLVTGIAVCRACSLLGITNTKLKWPNDIYWNLRKLGGILIEIQGEPWGPCNVVIGIGLNIDLNKEVGADIEQPWVDCSEILGNNCPSRNELAAILLFELAKALNQFQQLGFESFVDEWQQFDILQGQPVFIHMPDKIEEGIAVGINSEGALIVNVNGKERPFYSGDASLRLR